MEIIKLDYEDERWERFVRQFPSANIFHSPEMNSVFSISGKFESLPLFVSNKSRILSAAFLVIFKYSEWIPGKYSKRALLYGSPLYMNSDEGLIGLKTLMNEIVRLARRDTLFLEIRNSEKFPANENDLDTNELEYVAYQNYLLNLKLGSENLWRSLNSDTRRKIRRCRKAEARIIEVEEDRIEEVVQLLDEWFKWKRIPHYGPEIFRNAFKVLKPKGMIRVNALEFEDRLVSARINLFYNNVVFDWFTPSESGQRYNKMYPNDALVWDCISWAVEKNFATFDFGGGAINGEMTGDAKFKAKFRGEVVEYGRYRLFPNPLICLLARKVYYSMVAKRRKSS